MSRFLPGDSSCTYESLCASGDEIARFAQHWPKREARETGQCAEEVGKSTKNSPTSLFLLAWASLRAGLSEPCLPHL